MKSEEEIREQIEKYEERADGMVTGSPDWNRIIGKKNSLEWVLRE